MRQGVVGFGAGLLGAALACAVVFAPPARAEEPAVPHATSPADPPLLHVGERAPSFGPVKLHNPTEAGMPSFILGRYVGDEPETPAKAVLISFFATWCGPCKKELPALVALSEKYKAKGLQVVSISIDKEEEQFKIVRELVTKNGITFPVLMDRYNLLARRYLGEKTAMPSVFLVKADGTIALVKQGYDGDASAILAAEIDKVLGG
jgi:thiol-disulfide isomerase/thioredoxin